MSRTPIISASFLNHPHLMCKNIEHPYLRAIFELRPHEGDHFCPPKVNIQYFINSKGQYWILHKFQRSILNTSQISRFNIQYFSNSKSQYSILLRFQRSILNTSQIPRINIHYFSNSKDQHSILYKFQGSIFNTSQIPRVNIQNLTNSQLLLVLIYIKACVRFF